MLSGIDVSCIADSSVGGIAELSAMVAICSVAMTLMSLAQRDSGEQQQMALTELSTTAPTLCARRFLPCTSTTVTQTGLFACE